MNPVPEEQEDWVRELRETWPTSSPPLHLRPRLAPAKKTQTWIFLLEAVCVALLVLSLIPWIPQPAPVDSVDSVALAEWPESWDRTQNTERVGLHQRRQAETAPEEQTMFVTRRPDLRNRLQRAGRRLNPNPIGS